MPVLIENRVDLADKMLEKKLKNLNSSILEALPENCSIRLIFQKDGLNLLVGIECVISGRLLFKASKWVPRSSVDWHQSLSRDVIELLLNCFPVVEEPTGPNKYLN